jgi:hypothetical protein
MDWATSPAETRGVQPPKTPAEFTEWKKTHTSIEIWVRFYFVEKRWIFYICRRARLRSRQLGQTVVSPSRRLSRLDNKPSSAITAPCGGSRPIGKRTRRAKREPSLASTETTGCVRDASYGCESKLPLARLSARPRGRSGWRTIIVRPAYAADTPPSRNLRSILQQGSHAALLNLAMIAQTQAAL